MSQEEKHESDDNLRMAFDEVVDEAVVGELEEDVRRYMAESDDIKSYESEGVDTFLEVMEKSFRRDFAYSDLLRLLLQDKLIHNIRRIADEVREERRQEYRQNSRQEREHDE